MLLMSCLCLVWYPASLCVLVFVMLSCLFIAALWSPGQVRYLIVSILDPAVLLTLIAWLIVCLSSTWNWGFELRSIYPRHQNSLIMKD